MANQKTKNYKQRTTRAHATGINKQSVCPESMPIGV